MAEDFEVDVLDLYGKGELVSNEGRMRVWRLGGSRIAGLARALCFLRRMGPGVVHFHVSAMRRFRFVGFFFLASLHPRARVALTVHSGSLVSNYRSGGPLGRILFRALVQRFDRLVAVNDEQRKLLEECGVDLQRIAVIPAYLPPVSEPTDYTDRLMGELRSSGRKLVVLSGYGLPLYGFDRVLDVLERDAGLRSQLSVVVCTYNTFDRPYMEELERRATALGEVRIVRNLSPGEFAFLLSKADLYVRTTDRDGDAVAIREAGYFGVPVVASDCVVRPAGVRLFRHGNLSSLAEALRAVLERPSTGLLQATRNDEPGAVFKRLYRELCAQETEGEAVAV